MTIDFVLSTDLRFVCLEIYLNLLLSEKHNKERVMVFIFSIGYILSAEIHK